MYLINAGASKFKIGSMYKPQGIQNQFLRIRIQSNGLHFHFKFWMLLFFWLIFRLSTIKSIFNQSIYLWNFDEIQKVKMWMKLTLFGHQLALAERNLRPTDDFDNPFWEIYQNLYENLRKYRKFWKNSDVEHSVNIQS